MIFTSKTLFDKVLKHYNGITLWPFIILKQNAEEMGQEKFRSIVNHERIHLRQQVETLIVFFYLLYAFFYIRNRIKGQPHWKAYMNIPFEKESYKNEQDFDYLKNRKLWQWRRYI